MAKIIELVGVSGVGKTAVYRGLKWGQPGLGNTCPFRWALSRVLINDAGMKGYLRWLEYQFRSGFPPALEASAAKRFISENPDFVHSVWEMLSCKARQQHMVPEVGFEGARLFYRNFFQHQLVHEFDDKEYVLLDEGFVQRFKGYRVGRDGKPDGPVLERLGEFVYGIIFLDCPAETIEKRAEHEGGKYKNTTRKERMFSIRNGISEYLTLVDRLEKNGIRCLRIDASGELADTVQNVQRVLKQLA